MKTGKVAAEHTLTAAGIGANAVAYAYVDYAGANTEFTLTHVNAYLKFNLSSSEFAGYALQGVTLWAAGAELSGDIEVGNGDAVTYKGTGDYVTLTIGGNDVGFADVIQKCVLEPYYLKRELFPYKYVLKHKLHM